ncbi:glycoside hydrolase family 32 protein [Litorilinea aerophila]|uniref:beta-fructofuranosidase n=1 Tax=Litorilinea aerophila TaxID=1204385 RepID=A0A540VF52_9CHLR|nr:glycoside hydrolase family 32 protein [Litorilinea aerophila]MCC9077445.1 glycoside hydrolase family 32 protein [Litorilinea aerophila]
MPTHPNPAIARAMASVEAAAARAAADPTRPIYHFRPPANWMNDPNGTIYHNGYYHLFYQHNPYDDQWGHIHWGHARSTDLVHWEHLPIALWPSTELGEAHCFSGCARVNGQGQPMLFYTKVGPDQDGHRPPNEQWAALGDPDWITWQKHPANPILSLETHGGPPFEGDWRDPYIFEEAGRTFLVLGGAFDEVAAVALYEADDDSLTRWHYRGLLHQSPRSAVRFHECPNFFKVGDQWILLTSPYRPVEYLTGTFHLDSLTFTPSRHGILDPGQGQVPNFYATNTLYDPTGRCILLGWVRGFPPGRGWNGCLALPRVLTLGPDGIPRQSPVPEVAQLRAEHTACADLPLSPSGYVLDAEGDALEIHLSCRLGKAQAVELRLRRSPDGEEAIPVTWDGRSLTVAGTAVPLAEPTQPALKLQLFLDRSVLELFADDGRIAVTRVIQADPGHQGLELRAQGGTAHVESLDIWRMRPI